MPSLCIDYFLAYIGYRRTQFQLNLLILFIKLFFLRGRGLIEADDLAALAAEGENVDESATTHVIGRAGVRWSPGSVAGAGRLDDIRFPSVTFQRPKFDSSITFNSTNNVYQLLIITSVGEEGFHFEPGVLRLRAIHVHLHHPVVIAKPNFANFN